MYDFAILFGEITSYYTDIKMPGLVNSVRILDLFHRQLLNKTWVICYEGRLPPRRLQL
jgi:hypothetical protein